MRRRRLLFVSPQFLFPLDAGGKIRTVNILRGLKGGEFEVTLLSPAAAAADGWSDEIARLADKFMAWPDPTRGMSGSSRRWLSVLHALPVTVAADLSRAASTLVQHELSRRFDVVVMDYVHAAIYKPPVCLTPSICLTHNVEAEILRRHAVVDRRPLMRLLWRHQCDKMERFERKALANFEIVVAISDRDAGIFRDDYGLANIRSIPTAVDLDYYQFSAPTRAVPIDPLIVFTGGMDSRANVNGVEWLVEHVWPRIAATLPRARGIIVGRNPPEALVARVRALGYNIRFTGFVDDVRPHMRGADIAVIPLLVGGGTRIKAYEAMAMGIPVVSTTLGVEGLPVRDGEHLIIADEAQAFADGVLGLILNPEQRTTLAASARSLVEENFGAGRVARLFERICLDVATNQTAMLDGESRLGDPPGPVANRQRSG